jgi:hypothetical protein
MQMTTAGALQEQLLFHATGRRNGAGLEPIDGLDLRPALLAPYRELTALRYDFPIVLAEGGHDGGAVRALASVIDDLLADFAPHGGDGERARRLVLRAEREMRRLLAEGTTGRLSELWPLAAGAAADDEIDAGLLARAGEAMRLDGELLDCAAGMPARLVRHLWEAAQAHKARRFQARAGALAVKLTEILRAAFIHSDAGREPETLRASVGGPHQEIFDFVLMSRLLPGVARGHDLPPRRHERIAWALSTLGAQPFFGSSPDPVSPGSGPLAFAFDDCASAMAAFQERRAGIAELVKALSIAELEADGRYDEGVHDPLFAGFDEASIDTADLAIFPDYLVCIPPGEAAAPANAMLMEVLASGLPIKILAESREILEASPFAEGQLVFGARGAQLARAVLGLDGVFVLQSSASNLVNARDHVVRGLDHPGPALFSVFSGPGPASSRLPTYLATAAAMEGRAFPAFVDDPGADGGERFSLAENPQPALDWPLDDLEYADAQVQRVNEAQAFTVIDYAVTDRRFDRYFALVPRADWGPQMVPVEGWLTLGAAAGAEAVPFVTVVDGDDALHRLVVDDRLMQAARRGLEMWHRLQEMGRVHEAPVEVPPDAAGNGHGPPGAEAAATVVAIPAAEPVVTEALQSGTGQEDAPAARPPDEPYIETIRCSSCNECTLINDRMFAYDANRRAYIADLAAGTYRELVEAAENCQLSIIHPGRPRDPGEPDLEELLKRAAPFA